MRSFRAFCRRFGFRLLMPLLPEPIDQAEVHRLELRDKGGFSVGRKRVEMREEMLLAKGFERPPQCLEGV
jgi:hypothetical protein